MPGNRSLQRTVEWTVSNVNCSHEVHLRHCGWSNMIHFIYGSPKFHATEFHTAEFPIAESSLTKRFRQRASFLNFFKSCPILFVIWYLREGKSNCSKVICWNSFSNDYDAYDLLTSYFAFLRLGKPSAICKSLGALLIVSGGLMQLLYY